MPEVSNNRYRHPESGTFPKQPSAKRGYIAYLVVLHIVSYHADQQLVRKGILQKDSHGYAGPIPLCANALFALVLFTAACPALVGGAGTFPHTRPSRSASFSTS